MEDPELIHHFKGHKEGITALHFNPTRKQVSFGGKLATYQVLNDHGNG